MNTDVLASSNVMLETGPSAVQAVAVVAVVLLVLAREVVRLRDGDARVAHTLVRVVRVAAPLVVLVLGIRLLVILQ